MSSVCLSAGGDHVGDGHDEVHEADRDDDFRRVQTRCGRGDRRRDRDVRLRLHLDRSDEDGDGPCAAIV